MVEWLELSERRGESDMVRSERWVRVHLLGSAAQVRKWVLF